MFWPLAGLVAGLSGCVALGMSLPSDDFDAPAPDGGRIKPTVGWLTPQDGETVTGGPDGQITIQVVHLAGRTLLQQVRRYKVKEAAYGDSVLLDRTTLRPVETYRWTPRGTYIARYNHRVIDRDFVPRRGATVHSSETLDVEPYSALGMELVIASLPLGQGYHGLLPVVVDTASRGWNWMRFEVQAEMTLQERPDQKGLSAWIVDCDNGVNSHGLERTRLYIAIDGRSVRKIQHLGPDNEILSTVRRMLLGIPSVKRGE
jgi:hypothetical protein